MLSLLRFCVSTWKANLLSLLEYRIAFIMQIAGMILNDGIYLAFWAIFFSHVKNIGGHSFRDILLIYAFITTAFGLNSLLFGNARRIAGMIVEGGLDYYLSMPRPVLLHILISRSVSSAAADIIFGLICLVFSGRTSPADIALFSLIVPMSMAVMLGFDILLQSFAFWLGDIRSVALNMTQAALTFSFYPNHLFSSFTRVILFTVIPAAYFSTVPARILTGPDIKLLGLLLTAAVFFIMASRKVFYAGIKRYESTGYFTSLG